MFRFALIFLVFCALFLNSQADLDITYFDLQVAYYNFDYFKDVEFYLLDDNKLFGNLTITNYLPPDIVFRVSITGATMGEYIVPTGFDLTLPMCDIYKDPILSAPILKAFNFSLDICPPVPGIYFGDEIESDFSLYPDTFRPNNYLVKTEVFNKDDRFFELHTYQRIV